jgi:short-subunit dehydrogenase
MKVKNKVIVVTGGGNGMGRELVLALVERGARVAAVDINADTLEETVNLAGAQSDSISKHVVDVSDREAVKALPDAVIDAHGAVDGLINNAGIIQPFVRINDLSYEAIERVLNVNLYGVIYMTKALLPHLLKRPEAHIVSVSSMGGYVPVPGQTLYGTSKAAVKLLTEGLYSELADTSVGVTVVFPGAIATRIAENSGVTVHQNTDDIPMVSPDDAAGIIIDAIEQDKFQVYIGTDAKLMNLFYRFAPKWAAKYINSQMKDLLKS